MSTDRVVATIPRRDGEELRATLSPYQGRTFAHLRVYYCDDAGEWKPSKSGIAIDVERFSELEDAVKALRREIDSEPKRVKKEPGRRRAFA